MVATKKPDFFAIFTRRIMQGLFDPRRFGGSLIQRLIPSASYADAQLAKQASLIWLHAAFPVLRLRPLGHLSNKI
jgi:hypothetical protein